MTRIILKQGEENILIVRDHTDTLICSAISFMVCTLINYIGDDMITSVVKDGNVCLTFPRKYDEILEFAKTGFKALALNYSEKVTTNF